MIPIDNLEGNCNTSTTSLLMNAGINEKEIKRIKSKIDGVKTGFGYRKPWTSEERKSALEEEIKLRESLSNTIGF